MRERARASVNARLLANQWNVNSTGGVRARVVGACSLAVLFDLGEDGQLAVRGEEAGFYGVGGELPGGATEGRSVVPAAPSLRPFDYAQGRAEAPSHPASRLAGDPDSARLFDGGAKALPSGVPGRIGRWRQTHISEAVDSVW
jgi:hypothetical protein